MLIEPTVPLSPKDRPLMIVGDKPFDRHATTPFSASHERTIRSMCEQSGISWKDVITTNLTDSTVDVVELALQHNPNTVIALGKETLEYFKGDSKLKLDDERGAPFHTHRFGAVVVPTYHPRQIFIKYHMRGAMLNDLKKAQRIHTEGWKENKYELVYTPTIDEIFQHLNWFKNTKCLLSVDIETRYPAITCIALAWSPTEAICIPFVKEDHTSCWALYEETMIWERLADVLETCPLIGQNAQHFDHNVLAQHYGINANFVHDTMFMQWECYQELPKTLAFLNSYYTDNPFHKDILKRARSGQISYDKEFEYCCLDTCVTFECYEALDAELNDFPKASRAHYEFNIQTARAYQYMTYRGVHISKDKLKARVKDLGQEIQAEESTLTDMVGWDVNVKSPKQVTKLLYDELMLEKQYKTTKKVTGEETTGVTGDYLTILYLARKYPDVPELRQLALVRKLYKRHSTLKGIKCRPNSNIISWEFNCAGTESGRSSGKKPIDGYGVQPQNVDRRDRDLIEPFPNQSWLKADLEGADSWTQAAQLSAIGYPELLEDLLTGLKPAQRLAIASLKGKEYMYFESEKCKEELPLLKTPEGETQYRIMKAVSHGSAYGMKKRMMHQTIFKGSDGEIFVPEAECAKFQKMFYERYNFPALHEFVFKKLQSEGYLDSANGVRRYFLGRKDGTTLRKMLAQAPQAHTAHVANKVIHRLFYGPENRIGDQLIIHPCNQVHDELDGMFDTDKLEQATDVMSAVWRVPISYWGVEFTIPFEAEHGADWGNLPNEMKLS